jgi:hypothetical protein
MDNIIEPNETFDFSKLSLAHPTGVQGGAYFTKIEYNKKPLYIETPKGQTKQGFVKTGKKYYCDQMFDKNAETLINWFENLEERCRKLIYEKRDSWFQNSLEESDIEAAFNSIIRIYKSGKYYLVRTSIKNDSNGLPAINLYNENEVPLKIEDIKAETLIISILEIQGIKFTSRNFQIEIEMKQAMALDCKPVFNSCLIRKSKKSEEHAVQFSSNNNDNNNLDNNLDNNKFNETDIKNTNDYEKPLGIIEDHDSLEEIVEFEPEIEKQEEIITSATIDFTEPDKKELQPESEEITLEFEELDEFKNADNLEELNNNDLNLEGNLETMKLKKPNQVYYELYKEARKKAKVAKKNAIIAYLEAKNIKKTYLIENLDDSDSEFDAEIDEVSESELEDFQ